MFALYVHWPFCIKKCPYCDFNSHVRPSIDHAYWCKALLRELDHYGAETKGRALTSVFFGGGTPSLMKVDTVAQILDKVGDYWQISEDIEINLEANPTSTEAKQFVDFQKAGVNRISIGVQSLDDDVLAYLGREHTAAEAIKAIGVANSIFNRTSFDLIYATPGQSRDHWQNQMKQALGIAGDHLSIYQLAIESGTAFHKAGMCGADPELAADLFEDTQSFLEGVGLPAYEVSNHAKEGQECKHNLVYWQGGDYVGIGPGAHGRLQLNNQMVATHQIYNPENWLKAIDDKGVGTAKRRVLDQAVRAEELLILGLRLVKGINLKSIEQLTGINLLDHVNKDQLLILQNYGLMRLSTTHLTATSKGLMQLNSVIVKLVG
jgi:putative oxygen-independent coproporphyrinogen III oxidase